MADSYVLAFRSPRPAPLDLAVLSGTMYRCDPTAIGKPWADWRKTDVPLKRGDSLESKIVGKRVLFLVHGFNVTVERGVRGQGVAAANTLEHGPNDAGQDPAKPPHQQDIDEYAALQNLPLHLGECFDLVIPVIWPGDGLPGYSYLAAFNASKDTGARFAEFLKAYRPASASFITHSLGARVVLETMAFAKRLALDISVDVAAFTAGAIDDIAFQQPEYAANLSSIKRIVVVSSWKDSVLADAFPIGDRIEDLLWKNYDADARAMGRFGPKPFSGAPCAARTEWYDIAPRSPPHDHGHDHYFPWPWKPCAPWPSGWNGKRAKVAALCASLVASRRLPPELDDWVRDRTAEYRQNCA